MKEVKTYAALGLQVAADAVEVSLQPVHAGMLLAVFVQDVVQVEVEDVGVEAADLHVVLEETEIFSKGSALMEMF